MSSIVSSSIAPPSTYLLRSGDVLLSLGVGNTSAAIKALDGGAYSHAAVWSGEGVIESTTPRVQERSLEDSLRQHPREYVDAYRHAAITPAIAAAVVTASREYVDRAYSFGDLFLCASLMAVTTTLPRRGQLPFLKEACEFLHFMRTDRPSGGEHVTCTQLVVRSFFRAGLAIRIHPHIGQRVDMRAMAGAAGELVWDAKKNAEGSTLSAEELEEWLGLQEALRAKCSELGGPASTNTTPALATDADAELRGPLAHWNGESAVRAEGEWRSNLVTPHELETSPDMTYVGRVFSGATSAAPGPSLIPGRRPA